MEVAKLLPHTGWETISKTEWEKKKKKIVRKFWVVLHRLESVCERERVYKGFGSGFSGLKMTIFLYRLHILIVKKCLILFMDVAYKTKPHKNPCHV